jgi:predicted AlkP superfamily pyrophosphatase or phosphodiesterase
MRVFLCLLLFLGAAISVSGKHHVIVISIDGLRPEFYLNEKYPTPYLQYFKQHGKYSERMRSVFPSYTYPAHVTMMTGALPARSGVYYNIPLNGSGNWSWFTSEIKVPTIWQQLKKNGLTSAAIQWPVSVGNDITYNIPEIWDTQHPNDRISESRKHSTPGLVKELEQYSTGILDGYTMDEEYSDLDKNSAKIAAYVFAKYRPDFLAVHFAGADGKQHSYGREHEQVNFALGNIDNAIGVIYETVCRKGLLDSTTFIVVGDHGFSNIHQVLYPNAWVEGTSAIFYSAGGSTFLYPKEDMNRISDAEKLKIVLAQLPDSINDCFTLLDRHALDKLGADSNAILALCAKPGVVFSNSKSGIQLKKVTGGHHGYLPYMKEMYTGFLAFGARVKHGHVGEIRIQDLPSIFSKLLSIPSFGPDCKDISDLILSP